MDEYVFVKSQKDKEKLTFDGYIYRHQRSRNHNHYFRCEDKNCNGSATLRGVSFFNLCGGSVSEGEAHNHPPIDGRKEVIEALTDLKSRSTLSNRSFARRMTQVKKCTFLDTHTIR